jgi:hypothetical protein
MQKAECEAQCHPQTHAGGIEGRREHAAASAAGRKAQRPRQAADPCGCLNRTTFPFCRGARHILDANLGGVERYVPLPAPMPRCLRRRKGRVKRARRAITEPPCDESAPRNGDARICAKSGPLHPNTRDIVSKIHALYIDTHVQAPVNSDRDYVQVHCRGRIIGRRMEVRGASALWNTIEEPRKPRAASDLYWRQDYDIRRSAKRPSLRNALR